MTTNRVTFKPFSKQKQFIKCKKHTKGAFAGKRGGKTEIGAIQGIVYQETQPNYVKDTIDPFLGIIMAPTHDMLERLSWKKFKLYAKPFIKRETKKPLFIEWQDCSEVIGISADKPERLEGQKAYWIWLDEVFQMKEQVFLEALARVADQDGYIICTGSLGVQYVNPKEHWIYKYFKENPDDDTACFEWPTVDNPFFPRKNIEKLRNILDEVTFRQMFEIDWDTTPISAVYGSFGKANVIKDYKYNKHLPTYVSVDWGWAHPMAAGFFQYNPENDTVYLFDEIIGSKITLKTLHDEIKSREYRIEEYFCDISGNQEREQTGISNVQWFKDKGIKFTYRWTAVTYGIPVVRSYIKNGAKKIKFFVNEKKCPKSISGVKSYRYPEKDGKIQNENPIKKDDDACDMIRYFFVNRLDENIMNRKSKTVQM